MKGNIKKIDKALFAVPNDQKILAAIGVLSIRHGQFDYILRMTIKSLMSLSIQEALDATVRLTTGELRKRVIALARRRLGDGQPFLKLEAILERSRRISVKRNELIHNVWSVDSDGNHLIRNDDHTWTDIPTIAEIEKLAIELLNVTAELNEARLLEGGFLFEALKKAKPSAA